MAYINEISGPKHKKLNIRGPDIRLEDRQDWINAKTKDDMVLVLEDEIGRIIIKDSNGRDVGYWWLDSIDTGIARRELIKAQKDGHNVLIKP